MAGQFPFEGRDMSLIPVAITLIAFGQTDADEVSLKTMQQRVQDCRVALTNDASVKTQLVTAPVFRYSDELRHIEDAGLWIWTERGRPVATLKVEHYKDGVFRTPWLYCFASLSPELVSADWDGDPPFRATQPGVTWTLLDDRPSATRAGRLVQMREFARRFSAELEEPTAAKEVHQMRLLSRPLYRYEEQPATNEDGAMFGFTGTGTNPDLLLLFDLSKEGMWRFGAARMTAAAVTVRLQDKVVHEFPSGAGKGRVFDTWTYFLSAK